MDKQIVVYSCNGILVSNKMKELVIYTIAWMNLKLIVLYERIKSKCIYCMALENARQKANQCLGITGD